MSQEKVNQKLEYLEKALSRLNEMLDEKIGNNRAEIDSTIQRFEFCFELYWKTLKAILEEEGFEAVLFPKQSLSLAYQSDMINDEEIWLEMLKARNETSHIYDEEMADKIYFRIKEAFIDVLNNTFQSLKAKFYKPN